MPIQEAPTRYTAVAQWLHWIIAALIVTQFALAWSAEDLPLGVFAQHNAAEYVIALPLDALLVLYTDGITEHDRNPVRGETELVEAARYAFERPQLLAARTIARSVLRKQRGDDDAAALAVRTMPRRRP